MLTKIYKNFLAILFLFIFSFITIYSQQEESQMNNDVMKAYMDYMTPGDMQNFLGKLSGEWDLETTFWMSPDAPPMTSKGTSTNEMILGGRYLQMKELIDNPMSPMQGVGIYGFDNAEKKFHSIWIDNFGTGILYSKGNYDDSTKSIILVGEFIDPVSKEITKSKTIYKYIDDRNWLMEMYNDYQGKEYKSLVVNFKKK